MEDQDDKIEELINIALDPEALILRKDSISRREREVLNFIQIKKITKGETTISQDMVYDLYCQWTSKPLTLRKFTTEFKKYFKARRRSGFLFYRLEPWPFGVDQSFSIFTDPWADRRRTIKQRDNQYIGVYFRSDNKIVARIKTKYGYKMLGVYPTLRSAALAYDNAAIQEYGREAILNFPKRFGLENYYDKEEDQESQTTISKGEISGSELQETGKEPSGIS